MLMACWQRPDREPVILHSHRGTQFTSYEYQDFPEDHCLTLSMSAVGLEARSDAFDYIGRFHNPRIQRRINARHKQSSTLTQPSAKTG
jgi:putative transposase